MYRSKHQPTSSITILAEISTTTSPTSSRFKIRILNLDQSSFSIHSKPPVVLRERFVTRAHYPYWNDSHSFSRHLCNETVRKYIAHAYLG